MHTQQVFYGLSFLLFLLFQLLLSLILPFSEFIFQRLRNTFSRVINISKSSQQAISGANLKNTHYSHNLIFFREFGGFALRSDQCFADALQETSEYLRILYLCTALEDLHFLSTKNNFILNDLETLDEHLNLVKLIFTRFGQSEFHDLLIFVFLFSKIFILRLQRKQENLPNLLH